MARNCKQATFLVEKRMIGSITFGEYISLHIHLFGCLWCRLYNKQSRIVHDAVKQTHILPARLDDHFKRALQNRIDEALSKK